MPSDQVPEPMPKGLPYGENEEAQDLASMLDDDDEEYTPQSPEEAFLLAPSDRPAEPLTAGAPFGPGADATQYAVESSGDLLRFVAEKIRTDDSADPQAKAWAARRLLES